MEKNSLSILLADDDESDRLLFKEAFEELNVKTQVHMVNNGIQLMKYLLNKANPLPDLLFLDLNMPRKNGLECLKEIRSIDYLKDISIAIYSTSSSEDDIKETFLKGANVYINKPAEFNMLKLVLQKVITTASQYQAPPFNIKYFVLRV